MRSVGPAVVVVALVAAVLAGCGVPAEKSARQITPPPGPYQAVVSGAPTAPPAGTVSEKLFLVSDGKLVAVQRRVSVQPTADSLVRDLLAGPSAHEQDQGLSSALAGANVIASVHMVGGIATVEVGPAVLGAGRNDDMLAFAQVVCTLASRPEIAGVSFTRDGKPIGIPRADGSLTQGPLSVADYADLIVNR
ncbi:MAG TPA: GerMN domain-containing protein [Micromonosporaceae bacterium]